MPKLLSEIYHYTTIAGLTGIIESQTLWATHYAYLNDAEEIRYFSEPLRRVFLDPVIESVLTEFGPVHDRTFQELLDGEGGMAKLKEKETKTLVDSIYEFLHGGDKDPPIAEPFISSFCAATNEKEREHGLLSQWRGYSVDGGYVIAFDTKEIEKLLRTEGEKWQYTFLHGGDVIYSDAPREKIEEEFGEYIDQIKDAVREFYKIVLTQGLSGQEAAEDALGKIFPAILPCASRYKHWGFAEEKEVRIVAVAQSPMVRKMAEERKLPLLPAKPKKQFLRRSTPVPYIELFKGVGANLPITRVIVGPHREKENRRRAVEILLREHGIDVPVTESEIRYLG